MVASTDTASSLSEYLSSHHVLADNVVHVEPGELRVPGTPFLFLVDQDGTVKRVWRGKLAASGERDVFAALGVTSVELTHRKEKETLYDSLSVGRRALQLAMLSVATAVLLWAADTPLKADPPTCDEMAAQCADQRGTTVTYGDYYTYWQPYCNFDPYTQTWTGCWETVQTYSLGDGVEYFERDDLHPEDAICMCRY